MTKCSAEVWTTLMFVVELSVCNENNMSSLSVSYYVSFRFEFFVVLTCHLLGPSCREKRGIISLWALWQAYRGQSWTTLPWTSWEGGLGRGEQDRGMTPVTTLKSNPSEEQCFSDTFAASDTVRFWVLSPHATQPPLHLRATTTALILFSQVIFAKVWCKSVCPTTAAKTTAKSGYYQQ